MGSAQVAQDLHTKGQFVAPAPLHPVSTATSVQVRDGKSLVTDGPFAETREQLGGFLLINAQDLDEAIAIASSKSQERELAPSKFVPCLKLRDYQHSHDHQLAIQLKIIQQEISQ